MKEEESKSRIFIHMHYLEIGGAESALIGLLHALDPRKVNVDLFLNEHRGEMIRFIPNWVNLLPPMKSYSMIEQPLFKTFLYFQWGVALGRILAKINFKFYQKKNNPKDEFAIFGYIGKYVNYFLPSLKFLGKYDLAISFLTPHNIVADKVDAKSKICWIHTDYSSVDTNSKLELPIWETYDRIISISDKVTESFCGKFPSLKDKILGLENIISTDLILKRSLDFFPVEMKKQNNEILLLSIGRYCDAKNFDIIPYLSRYMIDNGLNLKWYIIGYGAEGELDKIKTEIKNFNVEKEVILLGKKENPYPYIKGCDWYIQTSRYEGKSITVREAQLLGKPVIIRNYPTAQSQINNGMDGLIASFKKEEFAADLLSYITDDANKEKIIVNLKKIDLLHSKEAEKIYDLMK